MSQGAVTTPRPKGAKGREEGSWEPEGANLTDSVKRQAVPVSEGTQAA